MALPSHAALAEVKSTLRNFYDRRSRTTRTRRRVSMREANIEERSRSLATLGMTGGGGRKSPRSKDRGYKRNTPD